MPSILQDCSEEAERWCASAYASPSLLMQAVFHRWLQSLWYDFWVLLNSSLPKAVYCVCFVLNLFQICCWTYLRGEIGQKLKRMPSFLWISISFSSHLLVSRSALTAWMISGARVVTVKRLLRFHHLAFVAVCLCVLSLSPGYNYLFNLYEPLSVCLNELNLRLIWISVFQATV